MFESRAERRMLGHKRNELSGRWTQLHNEELHNLCYSTNIIRMIEPRSAKLLVRTSEMRKPESCGYF